MSAVLSGRFRGGAIVPHRAPVLQKAFRIGESHQVEPSLNSVAGPAGTVRLEPKVMQVLVLLAAHAGQVVEKERLMATVWPDAFVTDDVLTRAISELRRVFGDDAKESRFIQTIPKSGYRLIARVSNGGTGNFSSSQRAHLRRGRGRRHVIAPQQTVGRAHDQPGAHGRWASVQSSGAVLVVGSWC